MRNGVIAVGIPNVADIGQGKSTVIRGAARSKRKEQKEGCIEGKLADDADAVVERNNEKSGMPRGNNSSKEFTKSWGGTKRQTTNITDN